MSGNVRSSAAVKELQVERTKNKMAVIIAVIALLGTVCVGLLSFAVTYFTANNVHSEGKR